MSFCCQITISSLWSVFGAIAVLNGVELGINYSMSHRPKHDVSYSKTCLSSTFVIFSRDEFLSCLSSAICQFERAVWLITRVLITLTRVGKATHSMCLYNVAWRYWNSYPRFRNRAKCFGSSCLETCCYKIYGTILAIFEHWNFHRLGRNVLVALTSIMMFAGTSSTSVEPAADVTSRVRFDNWFEADRRRRFVLFRPASC